MADIKQKQRAPIKILDKTKIGAERIKDNLVDVKTKDNVMKANKAIKTNVRNAKRTADATKKAIKTSEKVAKESKRVAKESAKMAQRIAKATREAAIRTAKAVKVAIKVTIQAIKAIIASTKAIISAIAAGGWVAVVIVIIITIIGGGFIAVQNMNNNGGGGEGGSGTVAGQVYQSTWGTDMVFIAKTQLGNQGGQPYWSWYGFENRVEWCACFVSWVANQCGYIEKGIIPKYSGCRTAVTWFDEKHQYMPRDSGYIPKCGDITFFDWKDKETGEQDGLADHTGIVEYTDLQTMKVHTIEENTSDSVAERVYDATNVEILGYGLPMYQ